MTKPVSLENTCSQLAPHSLFRVCRVDDDGILGLIVDDQVGVIITTAHPCSSTYPAVSDVLLNNG